MPSSKMRGFAAFAATGLVALLACGGVCAQDANFLPPARHAGNIDYRSGGIGLDESAALLDAAKTAPLTVFFVTRIEGTTVYTSAARVTLRDAKGKILPEMDPDGPMLLLDLVPGKYTIEASYHQSVQTHKVSIAANKPKKLYFVWKEEEIE